MIYRQMCVTRVCVCMACLHVCARACYACMCALYAHCITPASRRDACIARCSGTLNNTATFDNKRVSISALVCYVQVDTYTVEKTR